MGLARVPPVMAPPSPRLTTDQPPGSTLVIGHPNLGMAGVTAADYLVRHLDATQIGHLAPEGLPAITPFEDGVPRHHSRLYNIRETDLTVLVGELFVPPAAAEDYAGTLLEWCDEYAVEDVVILHGVPFPHGPDEHEVFYVATADYRERRLADADIGPLKGGFLDGVPGEILTRSLEAAAPDSGVLVTPTHPPGPDVEAALRLLDALEAVYGFDVDGTELRELGAQLQEYHAQLADRMATLAESEEALGSRDYPEDRMFM